MVVPPMSASRAVHGCLSFIFVGEGISPSWLDGGAFDCGEEDTAGMLPGWPFVWSCNSPWQGEKRKIVLCRSAVLYR